MNEEPYGIHAIILLAVCALMIIALGNIKQAQAYSYEEELRGWIEKLVLEESSGKEDIQIIDSNGLYSTGCLQFQNSTWEEQTKKYNLIHLDKFNCEDQKQLAYVMLDDNYKNWARWRCSVVNTVDSEVCTRAYNKMKWKPKQGIGKPPMKPEIEIIETDMNKEFCLL